MHKGYVLIQRRKIAYHSGSRVAFGNVMIICFLLPKLSVERVGSPKRGLSFRAAFLLEIQSNRTQSRTF